MSARIVLLLLLAVSTAGCTTPWTTQADTDEPPTTASTPVTPATDVTANGSQIRVEGGPIAADQGRLFQRIAQRRGVDVRPPERIQVIDPAEAESTAEPPEFLQLLGVHAPDSGLGLAGQTIGHDLVRINRSVATDPRIEGVLVHEYTHVIQNQRGATGTMFESGRMDAIPPFGVERPLLILTVREGAATYAADRYQRANTDTLPQGIRYERLYQRQDTAGGRYFVAPYRFGYRYVADRLAGNETVEAIYAQPPQSTEAIIHRYEPGAEPPANLTVDVTADQWEQRRRGRVGELGTRIALSASLNESQSSAGAAGWGNDALVTFQNGSAKGYVWIARWDDTANESEFRTALGTALDRQARRTATGWRDGDTAYRVRQGDARTTVVVVGPAAFARNATVELNQSVAVRGP
ncbi:hypothetical protein NDI56_15220 [Haloarcula sp. S1CR25-12]|uniref:DUF4157 domain-containing protein n=1 Tax=Haloarcula saliterrae TaxID=2950534 RepID=A0ABU2FES7_9EURY|nr:hypothetical protein [Haloarcula sp. S1CR25-12]MDS0260757.1 hypothetical protein [Haloarcula sp. S1CR25-12]